MEDTKFLVPKPPTNYSLHHYGPFLIPFCPFPLQYLLPKTQKSQGPTLNLKINLLDVRYKKGQQIFKQIQDEKQLFCIGTNI